MLKSLNRSLNAKTRVKAKPAPEIDTVRIATLINSIMQSNPNGLSPIDWVTALKPLTDEEFTYGIYQVTINEFIRQRCEVGGLSLMTNGKTLISEIDKWSVNTGYPLIPREHSREILLALGFRYVVNGNRKLWLGFLIKGGEVSMRFGRRTKKPSE